MCVPRVPCTEYLSRLNKPSLHSWPAPSSFTIKNLSGTTHRSRLMHNPCGIHTMHCSPTFSYSLKCKRFDWSFFSFLKQALQVKWYFPLCFFYHINTFLSSVIVSKVQLNQPMLKAQVSKNIYVEYQTQYD